jgi:uncharacterized membrane protein YraQ (UPF0718 family)
MNTKERKRRNTRNGGLWFLGASVMLYAIIALFDTALVSEALSGFFSMLARIVPILILVFVIMVGFNLFFSKSGFERHIGAESGFRGWFYAIIGGILVSGPPYLLYPILGDLKRKGATNALLATFLYNRNVKIPFIPVMIYYFGLPFTVIISVYIVLFSIMNGYLVGYLVEENR